MLARRFLYAIAALIVIAVAVRIFWDEPCGSKVMTPD